LRLHRVQHALEQRPRVRVESAPVKHAQTGEKEGDVAFPGETTEGFEVDGGEEVPVSCGLVGY
jgi:hypothetical protein